MRLFLIFFLFSFSFVNSFANDMADINYVESGTGIFDDVVLSADEMKTVNLSREWQNTYSPGVLGEGGRIVYHFGKALVTVVTSAGNVTDVLLEKGEVIAENGIFVGDTVNWQVFPIAQGSGGDMVSHIVVKPNYNDLETTMIVVTDRRSYYLHLKSVEGNYMTAVAFQYPEIERDRWKAYHEKIRGVVREKRAEREVEIPGTDSNQVMREITNLDFGYKIKGDKEKWYPVRVFNDGIKTYIQFPKGVVYSDLPVFVEESDRNNKIVNYRFIDDTYIVDTLFDVGVLLAGIGSKQSKVKIIRVKP